MRDFLIIGGVFVAAVALGVILFFFGPSTLQSDVHNALLTSQQDSVGVTVLEQGPRAISITARANYRITSAKDLAALWPMIYGERDAPHIPNVDFSKYEILAVFDGSHASGGYGISVTSVVDKTPVRTVTIQHSTPDPACRVVNGINAPFEIIQVPATALTISHIDAISTTPCGTN